MKFSIKDFFSKYDQTALKKSLMENLIFCAVKDCYSLIAQLFFNFS